MVTYKIYLIIINTFHIKQKEDPKVKLSIAAATIHIVTGIIVRIFVKVKCILFRMCNLELLN